MTERAIQDYDVESYGLDKGDYFPGVGVSGTDWSAVFVGIGDSEAAAAEDAVDSAASAGWSVETLPDSFGLSTEEDAASLSSEEVQFYHYVALFVR